MEGKYRVKQQQQQVPIDNFTTVFFSFFFIGGLNSWFVIYGGKSLKLLFLTKCDNVRQQWTFVGRETKVREREREFTSVM